MFTKLLNIFRVKDWWNYLIPPILSFVYIGGLNSTLSFNQCIYVCLLLFVSSIITASFGFYLNDLFDIEDDRLAKKNNYVALLGKTTRIALLFLLAVFSVGIWLITGVNAYVKTVFIAQYIFFISYSAPPLRLKKNKIFALLLDSVYSGSLFYLIATFFTNNKPFADIYYIYIMIFGWGFIKGLRNIILHIVADRDNDILANNKTLASKLPIASLLSFIAYIIIPIEVLSFIALIWVLVVIKNAALVVIVAFLGFLLYLLGFSLAQKKQPGLISFYKLNDFYEIFFPAILLVLAAWLVDYRYCYFIVAHYILFPRVLLKINGYLKAW